MEFAKTCGDGLSLCVVATTLVGILPALAALASLVWYSIRIYEYFKHKQVIG